MKINIPRTELVAALAAVKSPALRGGTLPILSNVLLAANESSVTLTSTDLDITLRTKVEATVKAGAGDRITVRAGLLHDIAASADGAEVSLELIKQTLHVTCGTVKFRLTTMDAEDFPPFSRLKDPVEFSLDDAVLHSLLQRTAFAVSTDENRAVLCGSLIQLEGGNLNVVATDGRRLAVAEAKVPVKNKLAVIIPGRAVKELLRLLNDDPEKPRAVTCAISANLASFSFGDTTLVTKLIEGKYPNYNQIIQIIPPDKQAICTVGRSELLHSVERVALVADAVKLEFRKQSLLISSSNVGAGSKELIGDANDSLLVASSREATVTLATPYLKDALKAVTTGELAFFAEGNIAMFKSAGEGWLTVIAGLSDSPAKPEAKK